MRARRAFFVLSTLAAGYVAIAGCGDDEVAPPADAGVDAAPDVSTEPADSSSVPETSADARSPELTGSACTVAADCYGTLDAASLKGVPVCIDKAENGYCTHECQADEDCCAVEGECKTGLKQVCASFESSGKKYCFLSCEDVDIAAATDAGASDAGVGGDDYCKGNVAADFGCRSTGGGAQNRKVCFPTGTAPTDGGLDAPADAPADG